MKFRKEKSGKRHDIEMTTEQKKQPVVFHVDDAGWMKDFILECEEKGFSCTAKMMKEELLKLQEKINNESSLQTEKV